MARLRCDWYWDAGPVEPARAGSAGRKTAGRQMPPSSWPNWSAPDHRAPAHHTRKRRQDNAEVTGQKADQRGPKVELAQLFHLVTGGKLRSTHIRYGPRNQNAVQELSACLAYNSSVPVASQLMTVFPTWSSMPEWNNFHSGILLSSRGVRSTQVGPAARRYRDTERPL